jgi:hypothetical protein
MAQPAGRGNEIVAPHTADLHALGRTLAVRWPYGTVPSRESEKRAAVSSLQLGLQAPVLMVMRCCSMRGPCFINVTQITHQNQ